MTKRKSISASTRWQVFARDGFCCRYCGSQAGEEGVELAVDHMVSVADGGDNAMDNLMTACKRCNGGKSARSIKELPAPEEVVKRLRDKAVKMISQIEAMHLCIKAREELVRSVFDMKEAAYGVSFDSLPNREITTVLRLIEEFGPDQVLEWMDMAVARGVRSDKCVQYVCGIARNVRNGVTL